MLLKATLTILFFLMLTASVSLNFYRELFPFAFSTCDLKNHHLNTETPLLQAARPVLQAFWQSEHAPICYEEQQLTFIDTVVETTENLGKFFNSLIESNILPKLSQSYTDSYRTATFSITSSWWNSTRIKQNLMDTWANAFEPCIPICVKEAWKDAFSKPTKNMTPKESPVFAHFCKWLLSVLPGMDYGAILRILIKTTIEIATTAIEHAKAILKKTAISLIKRVAEITTLIDRAMQRLVLAITEFANATQQAAVRFISSIHNLAARTHKFLRYVRAQYGIVPIVQYLPGGNLECFGRLDIPANSSKEEIDQAFHKRVFEMNQNEIRDRVPNYGAEDGFMKLGQARDDAIAYASLHQNHAEDLLSLPLAAFIALLDAVPGLLLRVCLFCIHFAVLVVLRPCLFWISCALYKVFTVIQPDFPFLLPSLYVGFEIMMFIEGITPFRLGARILATLMMKKRIPADPPQAPECFTLLGVPPGSTENVIKKAYRKVAKVTHPDKFTDPEAKRHQTVAMSNLNKAKADALAYVVPDPDEDPRERSLTFTAHLFVAALLFFVALRVCTLYYQHSEMLI